MLNARRHRDGDQAQNMTTVLAVVLCSTPGGIETVISAVSDSAFVGLLACSTPGGIETVISVRVGDCRRRAVRAQRPEASRR